jgi:tetratricopeptide (TPR) repeat protein
MGSVAVAQPRPTVAARVYADKAQEHFYSFELDEAIALYKKATEIEPENPDYWAALGHSYLFQQLARMGRVDREVYTSSRDLVDGPAAEPPADLVQAMWDALGHARSICERRIAANPRDADAHYFLGLTYAVEANFHFNVRGKPLDALRPGNRAKELHARVRELDPANHDANLLLGFHTYIIGSVPASFRWILYLAGYSGSKERGVELMLDALVHGKRGPGPALVLLAYAYNRERQVAHSRQMLRQMLHFYPRNYVMEMEIAASHLKEQNPDAAIAAYQEVARKMESAAPGYARVNAARLYFQIAAIAGARGRWADALAYFDKVLHTAGGTDGNTLSKLQAHTLVRLGDIHARMGQKPKARENYQRARQSPFPEVQRLASARLKAL